MSKFTSDNAANKRVYLNTLAINILEILMDASKEIEKNNDLDDIRECIRELRVVNKELNREIYIEKMLSCFPGS